MGASPSAAGGASGAGGAAAASSAAALTTSLGVVVLFFEENINIETELLEGDEAEVVLGVVKTKPEAADAMLQLAMLLLSLSLYHSLCV